MGPSVNPSELLEVVPIDVPAGHIEPSTDTYHVLDLHAGEPVEASIRLDGRQIRGPQLRGDINLVPAGFAGRWLFEAPATALLLRLAPRLYEEAAETTRSRSGTRALQPAISMQDPHLAHIGWMLKEERRVGYPNGKLWLESAACAIALRLVRRSQPPSRSGELSRRALPKWLLSRVANYIDTYLDQDLSLGQLAGIAGFSVPHFKVLFGNSGGLSAHRYVVERRVERARQLILQGRRPMSDIALDVGFAHQGHLTRCMQRVLGIGPAQMVALYGSAPKRRRRKEPTKFS